MQSFMKTSFPDSTSIPTVYCSQRDQPDEDLWDCLAIYSSGIPNKKFNVVFSFDYQGDKGKINILVDPLKSALPTRSRKWLGEGDCDVIGLFIYYFVKSFVLECFFD